MLKQSICAAMLLSLVPAAARANPIFLAAYAGALTARLDWSSDLGVDLINNTGAFSGTGVPVTQSAAAVRDNRSISANITQTAPYVLGGQYWAASWTGSINVPGPGLYGLAGLLQAGGNFDFSITGQTPFQNANTQYYFASIWNVNGPSGIHPFFGNSLDGGAALSGTKVGSFTLQHFYSFGGIGFPIGLEFGGQTFSFDSNQPGIVNFSYQIAFSTTPIDTTVFNPPAASLPEPSTLLLLGAGLAGLGVMRRRKSTSTTEHGIGRRAG